MAVVNQNSNAITSFLTNTQVTSFTTLGDPLESVGFTPVATADSIGSTYRVCRIKSSCRVCSLFVVNDALTTSAYNIGLYAVNGGAAVNATLFGSAVSLATAGRSELLTGAITAANIEKRVWELLGLAKDPYVDYDLVFTTTTAATAAGNIGIRCQQAY